MDLKIKLLLVHSSGGQSRPIFTIDDQLYVQILACLDRGHADGLLRAEQYRQRGSGQVCDGGAEHGTEGGFLVQVRFPAEPSDGEPVCTGFRSGREGKRRRKHGWKIFQVLFA